MTANSGIVRRRPRWLAPASLALAVLGLLVSAYLTFEHFTGSTTLACSDSGAVNCAKVTTSDWSRFLGMPVAVLGLAFFVAMVVLCLPVVWRRAPRWVDYLRLAAAGVGMVMVLYLVWAEFFKINAICLWCTGVHVITFVLLIVLLCGEVLGSVEPVR
ncbi:vitamin K epoxide reductase family protein [Calidifontibacter sp. DB0510]|uniref:Vitamin K epoxide reductase family protein n=1 Tax=Metallococcus carri TaxID=1656884 RepID=A0A967EHU2_9MICO|nr:vitamin K epoxide reductase family protein [Metallococcus carri]NHN57093.1 vitamin K epoxide reductase family protein [Metallococcus carri]NOP39038.1 vitamin K epoxide reductase family protein [Calidifontibacter sp. DB2511S]